MLRCSWSAASLSTCLKVGETRRFRVSLLVSVNRMVCPASVCAVALVYRHPACLSPQDPVKKPAFFKIMFRMLPLILQLAFALRYLSREEEATCSACMSAATDGLGIQARQAWLEHLARAAAQFKAATIGVASVQYLSNLHPSAASQHNFPPNKFLESSLV